ncbi:flagellar protein FliT [Vibrio fujianensis]|uniref:flagellar protein FliT n=1 Tax=Vibrio fujianensis TaxID=1974215 RepID=UPI000C16659F|nr:flagellar protein FliT [Vibrio fujianensis]
MQTTLERLCDINRQIKKILMADDINTEEIILLVDKRETVLEILFKNMAEDPSFAHSTEWQSAILETQHLVELMQKKTQSMGNNLKKYRYGNKSVQQYKKFL